VQVLLLVLASALGMLAVGQGASWDRSQRDQADFRAGASVRVQGTEPGMGQAVAFPALPGVSDAAPARRIEVPLQNGRTATALALDTSRIHDGMLLRDDLSGTDPDRLLRSVRPARKTPAGGVELPAGTRAVVLGMSATTVSGEKGAPAGETTSVAVTLEDRFGIPYHQIAGDLPVDGRPHRITLDLGTAPHPLRLTGVELVTQQHLDQDAEQKVVLRSARARSAGGTERPLAVSGSAWRVLLPSAATEDDGTASGEDERPAPPAVHQAGTGLSFTYRTGFLPAEENDRFVERPTTTVRLTMDRRVPLTIPAVASDRFLASAGLEVGGTMDLPVPTGTVRVRITDTVHRLPTTGTQAARRDGGALLLDLRAANQALTEIGDPALDP
ncbi:ABC transporter permease, partial [Streptomyces sp. SID5785]|nr:ABC transporter permease [Streptomyces sp. SID5785]